MLRTITLTAALVASLAAQAIAEELKGDGRSVDSLATALPAPLMGEAALDPKAVEQRPYDDSDVEMQSLMLGLEERGGCPIGPHDGCAHVRSGLTDGGDRLATYLIDQVEQSKREGYKRTFNLLSYVAFTESETGFDYLAARLRNRDALTYQETRETIRVLGYASDERVFDEVIPIWDETEDSNIRADVLRAVVRTIQRTETQPDHVVKFLRGLDPKYHPFVTYQLPELDLDGD